MKASRARRLALVAIKAGKGNGLTFRAIGGVAVMLLCAPASDERGFRTETNDVDLLGYYEEQVRWQPLFEALGFRLIRNSTTTYVAQYEFVGQFEGEEAQIHVFADPLHATELVPGPYFTELWEATVPPSSLLLSKLLIRREEDRESQRADIKTLFHAAARGKFSLDFDYLRYALKCGMAGWRRWLFAREALLGLTEDNGAPDGPATDRSEAVKLCALLEEVDGDWQWRCARWMHQHGLPGPVYMNDHVEPLA